MTYNAVTRPGAVAWRTQVLRGTSALNLEVCWRPIAYRPHAYHAVWYEREFGSEIL